MQLNVEDTIVAIATARQGAARGIIRISGPQSLELLGPLFRSADGTALAGLGRPAVVSGHLQVDRPVGEVPVQLYVWPTAASYTRQISAELHAWGAVPLLDAICGQLCRSGARLAGPGEFTLRAFLAGRLDLTQAEAVLGVIDATDRRQLETALSQLAGGLAAPLQQLRHDLLNLLADLEAGLDFADEDISLVTPQQLIERLGDAHRRLAQLQNAIGTRSLADQPPLVVIYGLPNVGKSTLWNALCGHGEAIVSEISGTTRDCLVARVELGGVPVRLADTAGLRFGEALGPIDRASQQAAQTMYQQADVRVLCLDATRPLAAWEQQALARDDPRQVVVCNKVDVTRAPHGLGRAGDDEDEDEDRNPRGALAVSAVRGDGLAAMRQEIAQRVRGSGLAESPVVTSTALRCNTSLQGAGVCLAEATDLTRTAPAEEVVAGLLRAALDHLGEVTGEVYSEDLLDRIFARFCIGK